MGLVMLVRGYIAVFKAMVHVLESMLFNMEKRFCVIIYELTLKKRNMNSSQTFLCFHFKELVEIPWSSIYFFVRYIS